MTNDSVPPGWSVGHSRTHHNRPYYYHKASKHTQWHFPTPEDIRDPATAKRLRLNTTPTPTLSLPSIAIIVPYRDLHPSQNRAAHLRQFLPHMTHFLSNLRQPSTQEPARIRDYHIYIVEQSDDQRKFNRGKLLNIGFHYAIHHPPNNSSPPDIFIFHDVDLLPQPPLSSFYAQYPTRPLHIARLWDRYSNNPKYFGGIVSFSREDMEKINGYPNNFWGWGGEDDEMQARCESVGIQWDAPTVNDAKQPFIVDLENMDLTSKLNFLKSHKEWKCMVKWEALEEHASTWRINGLKDLNYDILQVENNSYAEIEDEEGKRVTKITVDVKLNGNHWTNNKCGVDYLPSG